MYTNVHRGWHHGWDGASPGPVASRAYHDHKVNAKYDYGKSSSALATASRHSQVCFVICIYMYTCVHIYMYIYIYIYICTYICVCIYIYVYVCIYIYAYL